MVLNLLVLVLAPSSKQSVPGGELLEGSVAQFVSHTVDMLCCGKPNEFGNGQSEKLSGLLYAVQLEFCPPDAGCGACACCRHSCLRN